jgi:hypothetical protein
MASEMFIAPLSRTAGTHPHKMVMKTTIVFLFLFGMFHFVRQGGWKVYDSSWIMANKFNW